MDDERLALNEVWILVITHDPSNWELPGLPDAATQERSRGQRDSGALSDPPMRAQSV